MPDYETDTDDPLYMSVGMKTPLVKEVAATNRDNSDAGTAGTQTAIEYKKDGLETPDLNK